MNRTNKERLKSFILTILVISSLIQVGILWSYQNHGFPISFISGFFNASAVNVPVDASGYIKPLRVVVSEGYDGSHWAVYRNRDEYNKLWDEAKSYITDIMYSSQLQGHVEAFSDNAWGKLVTGRAFIFEFRINVKTDILSLMRGENTVLTGDFTGVSKIIISPWDDINNNVTIYILDSDSSRIHSYVLPIKPGRMPKDSYNSIIDKLKRDASLRSYNVMAEANFIKREDFSINNDVLVVMSDKYRYANINSLKCVWPDEFRFKNSISGSELDNISNSILGSENDSYVPAEDTNYRAYVFKNIYNTYRVYEDGLLEYKRNTLLNEPGRGSMKDAFRNVIEFINKRKNLIQGMDIYLSGIRETKDRNSYEFTFDYVLGDTPLLFKNYESVRKENVVLNNAITIEVAGTGVTSCWWIIKGFEPVKQQGQYDVGFDKFLDWAYKAFKANATPGNQSLHIRDINLCYKMSSSENNQLLQPVWVITTTENNIIPVVLDKK